MSSVHITLLYAGLLGLLLVVLSFNMARAWVRATGHGRPDDPDLRRAEALVASFGDYTPLALLLMAFLESAGAPAFALHALGLLLLAARFLHAFGSNRIKGAAALRFLGAQGTYFVIIFASLGCLYFYGLPYFI